MFDLYFEEYRGDKGVNVNLDFFLGSMLYKFEEWIELIIIVNWIIVIKKILII